MDGDWVGLESREIDAFEFITVENQREGRGFKRNSGMNIQCNGNS